MPITESRIKNGSLLLATEEYGTQPSNIRIVPETEDSGKDNDDIEVLVGLISSGGGAAEDLTATLQMTAIQDFTNPDGLISFSWQNNGAEVAFVWKPNATSANDWAGKIKVKAIETGGDVNKRLTVDVEWKITQLKLPTAMGGAYVIGTAEATEDEDWDF